MARFLKIILLVVLAFPFLQCKKEVEQQKNNIPKNEIQYAKGFSILNHEGYSVITVSNPWPKANKSYTYILKEKNGIVPDSLKQFPIILVPKSVCLNL